MSGQGLPSITYYVYCTCLYCVFWPCIKIKRLCGSISPIHSLSNKTDRLRLQLGEKLALTQSSLVNITNLTPPLLPLSNSRAHLPLLYTFVCLSFCTVSSLEEVSLFLHLSRVPLLCFLAANQCKDLVTFSLLIFFNSFGLK